MQWMFVFSAISCDSQLITVRHVVTKTKFTLQRQVIKTNENYNAHINSDTTHTNNNNNNTNNNNNKTIVERRSAIASEAMAEQVS